MLLFWALAALPVAWANNLTVGIIGAGASGLYSAILLQSLGIEYEILEASERAGGRIYTHYFDEDAWKKSKPGQPDYYNYFDVGAMRLPESPFMARLLGDESYSLIPWINQRVNTSSQIKLIPYIFSSNANFLHYNHVLRRVDNQTGPDPFQVAQVNFDPVKTWDVTIGNFMTTLTANFQQGFSQLSHYGTSVRQYLSSMNYSYLQINWLETFLDGTGHFDEDLTEIVLEDWLFGDEQDYSWKAVEGGMSRLVKGMMSTVHGDIHYSESVTAIESAEKFLMVRSHSGRARSYNHVINTAPLGAMQAMDMSSLHLGFERDSAIRMINYDPSMKIGIKFKSRWWQNMSRPIFGGQSNSDLPIRTCVYPSYGTDTPDAAAVMIASYTWGQDASRLASYLNTDTARRHLLNITLTSLATLNNVSVDFLQAEYVDHFAFSWYANEFSVGAFPEFGPGQFTGLMPSLMRPAAQNRMHFGGDAVSAGHAWIVGALNSGYRCVREILEAERRTDLIDKLEHMWGPLIDINPNDITSSMSLISKRDRKMVRRSRQ